jgi:hypothetical protein
MTSDVPSRNDDDVHSLTDHELKSYDSQVCSWQRHHRYILLSSKHRQTMSHSHVEA